ncbi:hypothetical protein [Microvirga sp. VF16]|uniref:hypothetical protein n=1 Tax=Microvirga sp. VF16 TaxID=2807101 RepID=UPI00193DE358|nr:hypothetical protein [Microvirga sp. VF16]QRM27892.1 hypothetical protein JO965_16720 [Microvirga sp. VF16]
MVKVHDFHQQIADLEIEINQLSDAAEQCRKSMIVARVATVVGILVFGAALLGLFRSDPIVLVISIAATLAGLGYYGSSRGSLEQITGKIRTYEARRAEMIDGMDPQTVQDHQ